ncbi:MAG TPA: prolyl oligopeptidase family serine peptidase [Steroidobacteraceae bacterium]
MFSKWRSAVVLAICAWLAACGGSGDDNDTPPAGDANPSPPPTTRGSLIESPPPRLLSISVDQLVVLVTSQTGGSDLLDLIASPRCGIDVHQLTYNTVDPQEQPTTASGALFIPTGSDAACQGARPILAYAHGTQVEKAFNIADLSDSDNAEGLLMAVALAAQGYIVVAPNYAGFHTSTQPYHAYLNADQSAKDTADAIAAARSALPTSFAPTVTDNGQLFLTGYSQGGHVAMATQRLLQQTGAAVTASAPMSGPYALSAFADAVFQGRVVGSAPLFLAYLIPGYQRAYGNIYSTPTEVFDARYASGIESLLPTTGLRSELFSQGLLPRDQVFDSTPPDPAYAQYTPATTPAELAFVFARGFGPDALIINDYRLSYLQDADANPDGGFPVRTDLGPPAAPAHPLRQAFKRNDLRDWLPTSRTLLCAGHDDPTVLYLNTELIAAYWSANGATAEIKVLDVDGEASLDEEYAGIKLAFDAAKAAVAAAAIADGATDNGAAAVADAYHSGLVPPFCLAAVAEFFSN